MRYTTLLGPQKVLSDLLIPVLTPMPHQKISFSYSRASYKLNHTVCFL